MGADIHMYVEYRDKKQAKERDARGDKPYWMAYGSKLREVLYGLLFLKMKQLHL